VTVNRKLLFLWSKRMDHGLEAKVPDEQLMRAAIAETYRQIAEQTDMLKGLHGILLPSVARLSSRFATLRI
jgi:hypothetical protein